MEHNIHIEDKKEGKFRERFLGILAIIGIFILVGALAWIIMGFPKITRTSLNANIQSAIASMTSIFSPKEKLVIDSETFSIKSGDAITLSWQHMGSKKDGTYSLTYPCMDGFHLETNATAEGGEVIFCNTPYHFLNNENSITLKAFSQKNRYMDVPIVIQYIKNDSNEVSASSESLVTITNENPGDAKTAVVAKTTPPKKIEVAPSAPSKSEVPAPEPTYTVVNVPAPASDPNGMADLSVTILETGTIDKTTSVFTATTAPKSTDRNAVKFEVSNLGTKASGVWKFDANLPTVPAYTYHSDEQVSLNPGEKIVFTLGFDSIEKQNGNIVSITIDPTSTVTEVTRNNNMVSKTVDNVQF